jgi:hypothetical protein
MWHFSSGLRSPTASYILQTSLFDSPEKSFLLLVYVETMAHASLPRRPSCIPHHHHVIDPRILNFLDISATVDASFPTDFSDFGSNSMSSEIIECRSSEFRCCSDDSMSTSS